MATRYYNPPKKKNQSGGGNGLIGRLWGALVPRRLAASPGPSADELIRLAQASGFQFVPDGRGNLIPVPTQAVGQDNDIVRQDAWTELIEASPNAENRVARLKAYDDIDANEGRVVLDTYADETLNISEANQLPVSIEISDAVMREKVFKVLQQNDVLTSVREDVRSMLKYGDGVYLVEPRSQSRLNLTEQEFDTSVALQYPFKPEDINLTWLRAPLYQLTAARGKVYRLNPQDETTTGIHGSAAFVGGENGFAPWEFVVFKIANRDMAPYGESILERSRVAGQQLAKVEQVLGITRANRLDRVAVKIPGALADPSSMLSKLSNIKNSMKSLIVGNSNSNRFSRNQDIGFTEYMYVPQEFEVQKLPTSVDVSGAADIDYFRDKYYNSTRLPKGFLSNDSSNGWDKGGALRIQDTKFARGLIPIQMGYCAGLTRLITLLIWYMGGDISKVYVNVSMRTSVWLGQETVDLYENAFKVIDAYVDTMQKSDSEYQLSEEDMKRMLRVLGVPQELFFSNTKAKGNTTNVIHERERLDTSKRSVQYPTLYTLAEKVK